MIYNGVAVNNKCETSRSETTFKGANASTTSNITRATDEKYFGDEVLLDECITGVDKDSREIKEGYLYIPFVGARVDGHDFIDDVFEKGALCTLSEKELDTDKPYILVENSGQALKDIAEFYREQLDCQIIGITGSVGKLVQKKSLLLFCLRSLMF